MIVFCEGRDITDEYEAAREKFYSQFDWEEYSKCTMPEHGPNEISQAILQLLLNQFK